MTFVTAASTGPGYFGTYELKTFPMPLKLSSGGWDYNGGQLNWKPQDFIPGSVGAFTYYTYADGPFQNTTTQTIDTGNLFEKIDK